ncbi:MAG: 30S ribosomal protein S8 [Candidatus Hadarchaeales archaeon]
MDVMADALSKILNSENARKRSVIVYPAQKLLGEVLGIFKSEGYIDGFDTVGVPGGNGFEVRLNGKINRCGAIKPRCSVRADEYEKWEKRYLPAAGLGILVVSTPRGVMSHRRAGELRLGGRLLAYVY